MKVSVEPSALDEHGKVALHSAEWGALCVRLQEIRVVHLHIDRFLRRLPPPDRCTPQQRLVGRNVVALSNRLDAERRQIRKLLPLNAEGL